MVDRTEGERTVAERLEQLEKDLLVVWELRRSLNARMESINRGEGVFDFTAREQLDELRRLERAIRAERAEVEEVVTEAIEAVLARRVPTSRAVAEAPAGSPTAQRG